ncbi:hypothetical protein LTR56_008197 [Elasticomyces elasticus]|nr:hypothetical protein LTR56_008197 [Elasticomyces elasticus]KAK3661762.1 hypothetical protein LTR22_007343 [Elasticomyces elasticus]KAK4924367.1 hypothetical protein LTR49_008456 [Elasticomyces elasticus]KAK5762669.1 hypothetical protein LTS12_007261 [Elasticomyces elasticus]
MAGALSLETVRALLATAAAESIYVAPQLQAAYDVVLAAQERARAMERAKVVDLSHYSGEAWYALNIKYRSSKGSVEYDCAGDAFGDILGYIAQILKQAHPDTSYGTKKSALETLRKIGKSIVFASSTLGSEVRKQMGYDDSLSEAMKQILESMTIDERVKLSEETDEKGDFLSKVTELESSARGYCMFEGLEDVLGLLGGTEFESDLEEEDDDDNDEDDGDNSEL